MRLRVSNPSAPIRLGEDLAGLLKSLSAGLGEIFGEVGLHSPHAAVADCHARPGYLLHEFPEILPGLDHVEKHGEGPQLHGARPHASEMVRDPGNLRENDPHVVAALRNRDPKELLHSHAVAHVVDERGDVVEPVGVRDDAVVVDRFRHLLEAAVEIADLHFGLLDSLPIELGYDPDDPVHRRVGGADVEKHIPRLEIRCVALRCWVHL